MNRRQALKTIGLSLLTLAFMPQRVFAVSETSREPFRWDPPAGELPFRNHAADGAAAKRSTEPEWEPVPGSDLAVMMSKEPRRIGTVYPWAVGEPEETFYLIHGESTDTMQRSLQRSFTPTWYQYIVIEVRKRR